jgi:hypothetical protein
VRGRHRNRISHTSEWGVRCGRQGIGAQDCPVFLTGMAANEIADFLPPFVILSRRKGRSRVWRGVPDGRAVSKHINQRGVARRTSCSDTTFGRIRTSRYTRALTLGQSSEYDRSGCNRSSLCPAHRGGGHRACVVRDCDTFEVRKTIKNEDTLDNATAPASRLYSPECSQNGGPGTGSTIQFTCMSTRTPI